jgi:glycosyltransferase involved in cell wall biosynthesis
MPSAGQPLVTVVTIFLDAAPFLHEAIESVRAQTYKAWELILVDDGSTDGSSALARACADAEPARIRYVHHDGHENRGMSASRNLGVRSARGGFIAFLDADDVWLPRRLETHMALADVHPAAAMICGPTTLWWSWQGQDLRVPPDAVRAVAAQADRLYRPPELLRGYLDERAKTPATCSVTIRREAFERVGGFEDAFRGMFEDQAFLLKAFVHLPVYVTSVIVDRYRQHPASHSARAVTRGEYSPDRPSASSMRFHGWLFRYLIAERITDRQAWRAMIGRLYQLRRHAVMTRVTRASNRARAWRPFGGRGTPRDGTP